MPCRDVELNNEYSKHRTRTDWHKSKSIFIQLPPVDEECIDKITIPIFCVTILLVIFNIVIYVNLLYIIGIIIGISMCVYKSI
jgi:hypothetical protein